MRPMRGVLVAGVLAAAGVAQGSRPESQPFVRIGERTKHPWPLGVKDKLWVVTADPFVCASTGDYFAHTVASMRLLAQVLGATADRIDGSE